MSERAQALEAIFRTAERRVQQYRIDGYPELADAVWNFYAEIERAAGQAPAEGVSPQPDETPDMGEGWFVTVGRFGASFVTLEETHMGGKPYFTPEDRALVRGAALHLLAFIGSPAPVSPVEPTPEPPTDFAAPLPPRPPAVVKPLRYDLVRYGVTWEGQDNQPLLTPMPDGYWTPWHLAVEAPTVEPEPCVWRDKDKGIERAGILFCAGCCDMWETASHMAGWNGCPYCLKPLTVER